MLGGIILGAIGFAAMGMIVWIIVDMSTRGRAGLGIGYALLFLLVWPAGLAVWLATRHRYPRVDPLAYQHST